MKKSSKEKRQKKRKKKIDQITTATDSENDSQSESSTTTNNSNKSIPSAIALEMATSQPLVARDYIKRKKDKKPRKNAIKSTNSASAMMRKRTKKRNTKHISTSLHDINVSAENLRRNHRHHSVEHSAPISSEPISTLSDSANIEIFSPVSPLSPDFDESDDEKSTAKKTHVPRSQSAEMQINEPQSNSLFGFEEESQRKHKVSMDSTDGIAESEKSDSDCSEDDKLRKLHTVYTNLCVCVLRKQ